MGAMNSKTTFVLPNRLLDPSGYLWLLSIRDEWLVIVIEQESRSL